MRSRLLEAGVIACTILGLLSIPLAASAADYKQWLPLLPETLGGHAISGEPDGVNMEMGEQSWSTLQQKYASEGKQVTLTVVDGTFAPQAQAFQMMATMNMETPDQLMKTLEVEGHRSMLQLEKRAKRGALMISIGAQALVIIEADPVASEEELIALALEAPLSEIAAQAK